MIKAYINNIAYELDADYSIAEQAANKIASSIVVIVDTQPLPQSGDIIEITDGATTYFLGTCGIPKSPQYSSPYDIKKYSITCNSANGILARRAVNVAFKNLTVSQIVQELFEKYIKAEGFALGEISNIPIRLNIYTAADYGLQYCLDELAEYVQCSWRCTNDRKFYFIAKDDFPLFPKVIEDNFIPITDLQVTVKDTDLRTSQIISGGTSRTAEQVESFVYDTAKVDPNNFKVSFGLAEKPTLFINKIELASSLIGVKGLNDNDDKYMFMFAFDSNIVTYNSTYSGVSPQPLKQGDALDIYYYGLFPIRAVVQNQNTINEIAKKTKTSGIIDNVIIDRNIKNINDAVQYGSTLLTNHGKVRTELKGWISMRQALSMGLTFTDFELLKKWSFNLPQYGAVGDFVLVERTLSPFVYESGADNLKISLKLVDRAFLRAYGQVFDELSKTTSQMSIRENDIIVDTDATDETLSYDETQKLTDFEDFFPNYCSSNNTGVISPEGFGFSMFSEQSFSEAKYNEEVFDLGETLDTSNTPLQTEPSDTIRLLEDTSTSEGAVDTEPMETIRLVENIVTTTGEIDTEKSEVLTAFETQELISYQDFLPSYCCCNSGGCLSPDGLALTMFSEQNFSEVEKKEETANITEELLTSQVTDFIVLFCTSEAQFIADGQILSPTSLSLNAFSNAHGG